jgi:hypothetical protein
MVTVGVRLWSTFAVYFASLPTCSVNLATGLVPTSVVIGGSLVFLLLHYCQTYRYIY